MVIINSFYNVAHNNKIWEVERGPRDEATPEVYIQHLTYKIN